MSNQTLANRLLLIAALAPTFTFAAECYTRSAVTISAKDAMSQPTDLVSLVTPIGPNKIKCSVKFRIVINNIWNTAEGQSIGRADNRDAVCKHAVNLEKSYLLVEIGAKEFTAEQQMVCFDGPDYRTRFVKPGDTLHDSEAEPHPIYKGVYYHYRDTLCRYFVERQMDQATHTIWPYTGVMCRITNGKDSLWQVIDLW